MMLFVLEACAILDFSLDGIEVMRQLQPGIAIVVMHEGRTFVSWNERWAVAKLKSKMSYPETKSNETKNLGVLGQQA